MTQRPRRLSLLLLILGVLTLVWIAPPVLHRALHYCPARPDGITQAQAVPAFARKYGFSCMQCHSSFPTLNEYGRQFKLNGYVPERGSEEGVLKTSDGSFWTEKNFPMSVIVRSRPYDKTHAVDGDFRMQPIQDIDMFIAGGDAARRVSYFGELDANSDGGFAPTVGDLQAGFHYNEYLNLIGARRGFFVMDPFQTLANFGSPTLGARAVSETQIPANNVPLSPDTMDQTKQTLYAYGEVGGEKAGYLYYAAGASAGHGNDQGNGGKSGSARLAFDTLKGLVVGAFGTFGHEYNANLGSPTADRINYQKTGADLLVEKGPLAGRAAFLYAHDRDAATFDPVNYTSGGLRETNRAAYGELMYVYKRANDKIPFLVPLIRQNWYQTNNGLRQFAYVTAQLAHYFASNVKAFIEYTGDTKQDNQGTNTVRTPKSSRWTGQIEVGF